MKGLHETSIEKNQDLSQITDISVSSLTSREKGRMCGQMPQNSYLCNKLGKVIFFLTRCGIFNRDEVEIKNASSTEKTLFLRIAHMIFSTGVWKIHKIWIFLIYY
jgi:hypothetical protein